MTTRHIFLFSFMGASWIKYTISIQLHIQLLSKIFQILYLISERAEIFFQIVANSKNRILLNLTKVILINKSCEAFRPFKGTLLSQTNVIFFLVIAFVTSSSWFRLCFLVTAEPQSQKVRGAVTNACLFLRLVLIFKNITLENKWLHIFKKRAYF